MAHSHGDTAALEELEWLRTFAAKLADSGDDDDLVQDTLLAAWSSAPRMSAKEPLRPWLAKVARNRARMNARSRRRRERRERESGMEGPGHSRPNPEQELDRLDILRAVLEALEALPEIDRKIVVRRFLHEENATQIGARLGMPPATVRSRLRRTLEALRATLDARFGGSRRSWALMMVGPAGLSSRESAPLALGFATKLALTVTALGLVVGGWWSCRADDKAGPEAGAESKSARVATTEAAPPEDPEPSERQRWEQRRDRIRATLAGREQTSPSGDEKDPGPEHADDRAEIERRARAQARAGFAEASRACAADLESEASGAITLTAVVIGDPEVGTIFDSIDIVAETVGDPAVLACVTEFMYAYVGDRPPQAIETRYTVTTPWIGDDEDDARKERRIFDMIVGAHHGEVAVCHESAPELEGTLTLEFTVGADGKVEPPGIVSTDLPDPVVECIVGRSQVWTFPKDLAGKMFRYPFRLPVVDLRGP